MKNFLKKSIAILLIILFLNTFFVTSFAVSDDYNYLLKQDYTAEELDGLTDKTISKMAELWQERNGESYYSSRDFLSDCGYPDEVLNFLSDSMMNHIAGLISDKSVHKVVLKNQTNPNENVEIKIVIAELEDDEVGMSAGEVVCVLWELKKNPLIRESDSLTLCCNPESIINFTLDPESFYLESLSKNNPTDNWTVESTEKVLADISFRELKAYTDLKHFKKHLGGSMAVKFEHSSPTKLDSDREKIFTVSYAHEFVTFKRVSIAIVLIAFAIVMVAVFVKYLVDRKKRA